MPITTFGSPIDSLVQLSQEYLCSRSLITAIMSMTAAPVEMGAGFEAWLNS